MSNSIVARLARLLGAGESFIGVYPADCIPRKLCARGRFSIIVNLGRWKKESERGKVGHFVAICVNGDGITYVDSYGDECTQPDVVSFLQSCKRPVRFNTKQIQSYFSKACGMYALLYILYILFTYTLLTLIA